MTAADNRSDRWSGRVETDPSPYTEFSGLYANKGPESRGTGRGSVAASAERRTGRVSSRRLDEIDLLLTPRDRVVLDQLNRFRYLSTRHFQLLHFADAAPPATAARLTRRLLNRLRDLRVVESLDRRIGGHRSGSAGYIWRVGTAGDQLLRRVESSSRDRRKEPSTHHLDHTLAIADCYCLFVGAARQPGFELTAADPEPLSWRRYLGAGGSREILKPDLYAVTISGEFEDHWFIEIDRSTESLPVVIRQCEQYERYRRTGHEQEGLGIFPLVLWVVPDEHRAEQIRAGIVEAKLDQQLFRVTTVLGFRAAIGGAS